MSNALGCFGSPGIVNTLPVRATMKPAPKLGRNSRTVILNPVGRPITLPSSDNDICVLAIQIGNLSHPNSLNFAICDCASSVKSTPSAPYTFLAMVSIFSSIVLSKSYKGA